MALFRNNDNFLDSTRSLGDGCLSVIIDASAFFLMHVFNDAKRRTFQVNKLVGLFFKCFVDSEAFCLSSCSCDLTLMFLTGSPMYDSWQEYTRLQITNGEWGFLLFSLNCYLTFLVIYVIRISYLLSVEISKFFIRPFKISLFFEQYGISTNTTFFDTGRTENKSAKLRRCWANVNIIIYK